MTDLHTIEPTGVDGAAAGLGLPPASHDDVEPARRSRWRRVKGSNLAVRIAGAWIILVVLAAALADLLPLKPFDALIFDVPPSAGPRLSWHEPLGTDALGRSMLSRLVYGGRQSLAIGIAATLISMTIGLVLGTIAGYRRGKFDAVIGVSLDSMLSIPPLVMLLALASVGRRDVSTVIIGLAIIGTPYFARLARASTISFAAREHVTAARAMGAGHVRIILRELLPDVLMPVSTFAFLSMAMAIIAEATLSFLGLGVPPPTPSWGGMVNEGRPFLETTPHLVYIPALCLVLTSLAFSVVGDYARRRFDKRESALR